MKKVVIYARVSTNSQDYERQIIDLRDYANRMDYVVVKEFSEKISGAKKVAEREQLSELLNYVEAHHIDKVLIYERNNEINQKKNKYHAFFYSKNLRVKKK